MAKTEFIDGNPAEAIEGTIVTAAFLNALNNHRHRGLDVDGDGAIDYAADTGTANAYAISLTPALTDHVIGMPIVFKAANANTGAATLNVNGLGAVAIKKNVSKALEAGDIAAGQLVTVAYDGTNYQLLSKSASDNTYELVSNLKPVVNAVVNKLDIFTKSGGAAPNASNIIRVAIPDGNGYTFRSRSAAYLSGTSQIIMTDATNYWGRISTSGEYNDTYLYAIWDGSGIVWALGSHSKLTNVTTTTTTSDPDYLLLEGGSTYSRNASHFCICVARIQYEYDTSDSPDHTFQPATYIQWGKDNGDYKQRIMIVADEKSKGTHGGTFTSGAWRTRDLNTIRYNTISGASLNSNQVTLPAGTYIVMGSAPALQVTEHQAILYNTTASADLIIGTSEITNNSASYAVTRSVLCGGFTLAIPSVLELRHYCNYTKSTDGFGRAMNITTEVYSQLYIVLVQRE
ncbi:MAG: hypothetical protein A4E68_01946 [Syntrophaceae bacterium PtaB.Bin095]|jgi:hypothetical protein|nr:MAG: hypothetical protein A4E68_01946 [Syntrophaceae bacterium PtaB.Bin095]